MKSTTNAYRTLNAFKSPLAVATLTLFIAANLAMAARDPNNSIAKPQGSYQGQSYGEWSAEWWQTMLSMPVVNGQHPLLNGGALTNGSGEVFLAAAPSGPATISITIPSGTPIIVPIVNAECSTVEEPPFQGETEPELRACANGHIDQTTLLSATIDAVPVSELQTYRTQSPLFEFTLPANNVLNEPAGTTGQAVDAGVYLVIKPLSRQTTHTIRVSGTFPQFNTTIDTTFLITVQ